MKLENDLGRDKISRLVFRIAIPSMLAQFVSVLYSIVDRMFVGNIPEVGELSLAGVGVCGPVLTMIGAFAFWVGIGGTPLMGIALGEKNEKRAARILANCFLMLCSMAFVVTILALVLKGPMLRLFGASDVTYPFAEQYFTVYVSGTVFALLSTGLNQFVIAQGYAKTGMFSVMLGAVLNIALDPLFIFVFHMGVRGAALATILSQAASMSFVIFFLLKKSQVAITFGGYDLYTMGRVLKLGVAPFLIIAMDNLMIISMNALLQKHGGVQGDLLISCNTIAQSFMLVVTMPLGGISGGTQSILSYNYGACNTQRVLKAERYISCLCMGYTAVLFAAAHLGGSAFVSLFTDDPQLSAMACRAIKICTAMIIPLGLQYALVDAFTGMGQVQVSLPLSFWRKGVYFAAIFAIPIFWDADMIFFAEPISDILCIVVTVPVYKTMMKKILLKREKLCGAGNGE